LYTAPKLECGKLNSLHNIIVEMRKFEEVLEWQESNDDSRRQLQSRITLVEDLTNSEPSTSTHKQPERIQLLRHYSLRLPLNGVLTSKYHSSALMVNPYLQTMALYTSGQTSQSSMINLGTDLSSWMRLYKMLDLWIATRTFWNFA
jgi:hypothetical protein